MKQVVTIREYTRYPYKYMREGEYVVTINNVETWSIVVTSLQSKLGPLVKKKEYTVKEEIDKFIPKLVYAAEEPFIEEQNEPFYESI